MLEIFFLMLFFNAMMSIFGIIGLQTPITVGDAFSGFPALLGVDMLIGIVASIGGFYMVFSVVGNERCGGGGDSTCGDSCET